VAGRVERDGFAVVDDLQRLAVEQLVAGLRRPIVTRRRRPRYTRS
jgi:hypothetical protein